MTVTGGPSGYQHMTGAPVLASIGTVLIDAFDSPPRLVRDVQAGSSSKTLVTGSSPPQIGSGPSTGPSTPVSLSSSQQLFPTSIHSKRFTPTPSSAGSGPSTPQKTFDDVPAPNAEDVYEQLGGGALYAMVGARMWLPPTKLKTLVDRSPATEENDVPPTAEDLLTKLGQEIWVWNRSSGTQMTRARIRYEGDVRFFHHVVKAPYRTMTQLASTPLCRAEYLHVSPPYSPEDVYNLLREIDTPTGSSDSASDNTPMSEEVWRPKIVFEPTPPSCHPGQKDWLEKILPDVYVFSPNHEELFSFYSIPKASSKGDSDGDEVSDSERYIRSTVERLVNHLLLEVGIWKDGNGIAVIRCGRLGACVATKSRRLRWCPAYFDDGPSGQNRVKDVTGAGNAFLGGYVAGLSLTNDPYEALLYATVSASFVVEQFGLPSLYDGNTNGELSATNAEAKEEWNGDSPSRRVEDLRTRLGWESVAV